MGIRKPIKTLDGADTEHSATRLKVLEHLLDATEKGCTEIGCTGISFVAMSMAIWMSELQALDATATRKFLNALATIADPKATTRAKYQAELVRQKAVRNLMAAVDLELAVPGGRA